MSWFMMKRPHFASAPPCWWVWGGRGARWLGFADVARTFVTQVTVGAAGGLGAASQCLLLAVMQQLSLSSVGYLPACGSCGGLLVYDLRHISIQTGILT